jgi:hypothetical protein
MKRTYLLLLCDDGCCEINEHNNNNNNNNIIIVIIKFLKFLLRSLTVIRNKPKKWMMEFCRHQLFAVSTLIPFVATLHA